MTKYKKDVHLGVEIKRVMKEKNVSVTDFAKSICCHRKNVYDIFNRKTLDIDRVIMISEILDYDFIGELYREVVEETEFTVRYRDGKLMVVDKK